MQLGRRAKLSDATIKFAETARHAPSRATLLRLVAVPELGLRWADVPGAPGVPTPRRAPSELVHLSSLEEYQGLDPERVRAYVAERHPLRVGFDVEGVPYGSAGSPQLLVLLADLEGCSVQEVLRRLNPRWRRGDRDRPTLEASRAGGLWLLRWEGQPPRIVEGAEVARLVRCSSDPFWVWPCDGDGSRVPWPQGSG